MEEQVEKFGSTRKLKRFHNKRQRNQVKTYLQGVKGNPDNFENDELDDDFDNINEEHEWRTAS
jgi:hypothetical protein